MILVLLVHADPSVRAKYEAACGPDVDVLPMVRHGLSSVYAQLAAECKARGGGSAIRGLLAVYRPPKPLESYDAVLLSTYSAGYAFARALTDADRELLAGYVAIDSAHAAQDPDGTAADTGPTGVEWLVRWAKDARAFRKVLAIGHSDVDPITYASTTDVAEEVARIAGPPTGNFVVRGFDLRPPAQARQEHGDALTVWGPGLVAEAVRMVRAMLPTPAPPAASSPGGHVLPAHPWRDPAISLGERCVVWSLREEARHDAEERPAGSNGGPYVAALLAPCERAGKRLGLKAGNYCAAGASAALAACLLPGELAPHGYRAAVVELVADAGPERWVSVATLRAGWRLEVGDLLVWDRSVPGRPETAWQRHVGRVRVASSGPAVATIEANAGTGRAWQLLDRRLDDPRLLGAITYPGREQPEPTTAGEIDVREAARLIALSDAVWSGAGGLPDLETTG